MLFTNFLKPFKNLTSTINLKKSFGNLFKNIIWIKISEILQIHAIYFINLPRCYKISYKFLWKNIHWFWNIKVWEILIYKRKISIKSIISPCKIFKHRVATPSTWTTSNYSLDFSKIICVKWWCFQQLPNFLHFWDKKSFV